MHHTRNEILDNIVTAKTLLRDAHTARIDTQTLRERLETAPYVAAHACAILDGMPPSGDFHRAYPHDYLDPLPYRDPELAYHFEIEEDLHNNTSSLAHDIRHITIDVAREHVEAGRLHNDHDRFAQRFLYRAEDIHRAFSRSDVDTNIDYTRFDGDWYHTGDSPIDDAMVEFGLMSACSIERTQHARDMGSHDAYLDHLLSAHVARSDAPCPIAPITKGEIITNMLQAKQLLRDGISQRIDLPTLQERLHEQPQVAKHACSYLQRYRDDSLCHVFAYPITIERWMPYELHEITNIE